MFIYKILNSFSQSALYARKLHRCFFKVHFYQLHVAHKQCCGYSCYRLMIVLTAHTGSRNVLLFSRVEYLEKSKHLQDQLRELRSEIEVLKVGEKQSELDQLHDEQVRLGETKYSTLRKVGELLFVAL